ncbi:MAG: serine hydrolase, partial [Pseudomonadota bacterium]
LTAVAQEVSLPGFGLPGIELPGVEQVAAPVTVWPEASWPVAEMDPETEETVDALIARAMASELNDQMGETRSIVVIHKGHLVAEAYRDGFGPATKQVSWSMAKSITHALVGRAIALGLVEDIDAPMPSPWPADDPRAAITWRHWLTMTDGLAYNEIGEEDLTKNDVVQMIYGRGRLDVIDYVSGLEAAHTPGTVWNYSTAGFHTIARGLQTELGLGACSASANLRNAASVSPVTPCAPESDTDMALWIDDVLFAPLGMEAQPEFDSAGTFLGGSLVYASAQDFARFGYLYLQDGIWNGERLLPEGWVSFARSETPAANANVYGAGWWITPPEGVERSHSQAAITGPYDAFHAGGNEGQTIWVVPSKDLVIVRLGLMPNSRENWRSLYEWNQEVARAFPTAEK